MFSINVIINMRSCFIVFFVRIKNPIYQRYLFDFFFHLILFSFVYIIYILKISIVRIIIIYIIQTKLFFIEKIPGFPWSYQYLWKRSFLGGSARHPSSFKATAGCTTEAVRSLKWRAVDCPNSSWKSIATPENLFANAAWNRRLTEYRIPRKNLFDSTQTFWIWSTMIEQDYFSMKKKKRKKTWRWNKILSENCMYLIYLRMQTYYKF